MDQVVACLMCVVIFLVFLRSLKSAMAPKTPIKGHTNVPTPPGLYTLPIVGNAYKFLGLSDMNQMNAIVERIVFDCLNKGYRAASFWMGPRLAIITADAKLNEYILSNSKSSTKDEEFYGPLNSFVDGVFTRNGQKCSDLRKPLIKLLQPKTVIETHFDVIVAKTAVMCQELDAKCSTGVFDMLSYVQRCSLFTTYETLMGIPEAEAKQLRFDLQWVKRFTTTWFQLVMKVHYRVKWILSLTKMKKEIEIGQAQLREFGQSLIKSRTDILRARGKNPKDPDFEPECYTDVTIKQAMKENHDGVTMPIDLIFAGFDTTSVSLSSACLFLAMHPEYQEKAYQEQMEIMGDTLRAPTHEETTNMTYLGMVYQETLRHIGVPAVLRKLSSEIVIDDYVFPEGATIDVFMRGTHMRSDYWQKPRDYYPDHFLPENVAKRPKGAFLPFSAGPRVCPGKTLALLSSKIMLSMLIRRFHFATPLKFSEMEYEYLIMLESIKGYPVQLTRRIQNQKVAISRAGVHMAQLEPPKLSGAFARVSA